MARRGHQSIELPGKTDFRTGYDLSLLDLAVQLVAVPGELPLDTIDSDWWYFQVDDALIIRFHRQLDNVFVLTNTWRDRGWMLETTLDEFFEGVRQFLTEFGQAIHEHMPELADWVTLEPIRAYVH